jgi:hypothetical protein
VAQGGGGGGERDDVRQGYPADKARQGRIALRTRGQRLVFVAGLVGVVLLALLVALWPAG